MEFNGAIFISQVVTFLIALGIVWKLAWKPLLQFMRDRQQKISSDIQSAEAARQAVARLEEDYKQRIGQIEQKANDLMASAKLEGEKLREQIVAKAQDEAAQARKRGQEQLAYEREQLMREMRAEIVGISMMVARKVLDEQSFASVQKGKFEKILTDLESGKEPQRAR
jgi:F-type H+-transporting ATPase subunit b